LTRWPGVQGRRRRRVVHMQTESYDVAVVGGGAAGLSAALVLGRARRRVVVIDARAPRNAPAAHMHGFLSRDGMPPAELLASGRGELRSTLGDDAALGAVAPRRCLFDYEPSFREAHFECGVVEVAAVSPLETV
jgi:glycine/D-amino acid oxidase-like deaminating enzyme